MDSILEDAYKAIESLLTSERVRAAVQCDIMKFLFESRHEPIETSPVSSPEEAFDSLRNGPSPLNFFIPLAVTLRTCGLLYQKKKDCSFEKVVKVSQSFRISFLCHVDKSF